MCLSFRFPACSWGRWSFGLRWNFGPTKFQLLFAFFLLTFWDCQAPSLSSWTCCSNYLFLCSFRWWCSTNLWFWLLKNANRCSAFLFSLKALKSKLTIRCSFSSECCVPLQLSCTPRSIFHIVSFDLVLSWTASYLTLVLIQYCSFFTLFRSLASMIIWSG